MALINFQPVLRIALGVLLPVLRLLLTVFPEGLQPEYYPPPPAVAPQYDFIIVGGGTAGSVMGGRLSEVEGWRVLVLEAGGSAPPESLVPGFSWVFYVTGGTATWDLDLHPQRHGLKAFNNRSSPVPQGRVLGGSSAVNGMLYVRGNTRDYDQWAQMGNEGWGYNDVLPYFKKAEGYTGPHLGATEEYHGRSGPLPVEPQRVDHKVYTEAFLTAGRTLGFDTIDPNGPQQIGFANTDYTIKGGERWHAGRAYLHPASQRNNLHILTHATVTKIIFDENKRAVGVEYEHQGKVRVVRASREVVLNAGAILSPKLLMLSGVGPQQHLRQHGIKVVSELPGVGENLQDHTCVYGLSWSLPSTLPNIAMDIINPKTVSDYIHYRKGPFKTPLGDFGHAWAKVGEDGGDPGWPDVQLFFLSAGLGQQGLLGATALGINTKTYLDYYSGLGGRPDLTIMPYLMRPKSVGQVRLRSPHPHHPPIVDPNYLSHPDDINTLVNGIKLALRIGKTQPFVKTLGARFHDKGLRECSGHSVGSDEYWRCYVRHMATTFYHFAGTCKMGPPTDPYSVVDNKLRVRGVSGLRVVDASIMPVVVSGNSMAAVIMVAERAADLIKQEWGQLQDHQQYATNLT